MDTAWTGSKGRNSTLVGFKKVLELFVLCLAVRSSACVYSSQQFLFATSSISIHSFGVESRRAMRANKVARSKLQP